MLVFASICPHPPLLLPWVGQKEDKKRVKNTLQALESLRASFQQKKVEKIIISSPHQDWGFEVPLYFLASNFKGEKKKVLTGFEPPEFYFKKGKEIYLNQIKGSQSKAGLIASADLSHCLRDEGPYDFHPDGPKFDRTLVNSLKHKKVETILNLDQEFPQAGECGLRSVCFLLGVVDGLDWEPEILSYEGPFGVGYLVAELKLQPNEL